MEPHEELVPAELAAPAKTPVPRQGATGVRTVLLILGGIGLLFLLLCGGVFWWVWQSINQLASGPRVDHFPPLENHATEIWSGFGVVPAANGSGPGAADPAVQAEVAKWLAAWSDSSTSPEERAIPASESLFCQAIFSHPAMKRAPLANRLQVKASVIQSAWKPVFNGQLVLLAAGQDSSGQFLTADVAELFPGAPPYATRLYLAREPGQLVVYDWADLDLNDQRQSGEYAHYFASTLTGIPEGIDEARRQMDAAADNMEWNDAASRTACIAAIQSAERVPCLPGDETTKRLYASMYYIRIDAPEEAVRVLATLDPQSTSCPGALVQLAYAHLLLQDHPAILAAVGNLRRVCPGHPAASWLAAQAHIGLGQLEEAAVETHQLVRQFDPAGTSLISSWLSGLDARGAEHLLELIAGSGDMALVEDDIRRLLEGAWWAEPVVAGLSAKARELEQLPRSVVQLIAARSEAAAGRTRESLALFGEAMRSATDPRLREAIRTELCDALLEVPDYRGFVENHDSIRAALLQLARLSWWDELYDEEGRLQSALAEEDFPGRELPEYALLVALTDDRNPERVIAKAEEFLRCVSEDPSLDDSDEPWTADAARGALRAAMLATRQAVEVLEQNPADEGVLFSLLDRLELFDSPELTQDVLAAAGRQPDVLPWFPEAVRLLPSAWPKVAPRERLANRPNLAMAWSGVEASWTASRIMERHVNELLRANLWQPPADMDETGQFDWLLLFARRALELRKMQLLEQSLAEAAAVAGADAADRTRLESLVRETAVLLGKRDKIIASCRRQIALGATPDYELPQLQRQLVTELLLDGQVAGARTACEEVSDPELRRELLLNCHLLADDAAGAEKLLESMDDPAVRRWLGGLAVDPVLRPAGELFSRLVASRGVTDLYLVAHERIVLGLPDEPAMEPAALESLLRQHLPVEGPVRTLTPDSRQWTLIADLAGGSRLYVTRATGGLHWGSPFLQGQGGPVAGQHPVLVLESSGPSGDGLQRLWPLVSALAPAALYVYADAGPTLWTADRSGNLGERLVWKTGLPVEAADQFPSRLVFELEWDDEHPSLTARDLDEELAKQAGGVECRLKVSAGAAHERLLVRITAGPDEADRYEAELLEPSQLIPAWPSGVHVGEIYPWQLDRADQPPQP